MAKSVSNLKIHLLIFSFCSRTEKEKAKFQQEVYELLAQIENVNKEKVLNLN